MMEMVNAAQGYSSMSRSVECPACGRQCTMHGPGKVNCGWCMALLGVSADLSTIQVLQEPCPERLAALAEQEQQQVAATYQGGPVVNFFGATEPPLPEAPLPSHIPREHPALQGTAPQEAAPTIAPPIAGAVMPVAGAPAVPTAVPAAPAPGTVPAYRSFISPTDLAAPVVPEQAAASEQSVVPEQMIMPGQPTPEQPLSGQSVAGAPVTPRQPSPGQFMSEQLTTPGRLAPGAGQIPVSDPAVPLASVLPQEHAQVQQVVAEQVAHTEQARMASESLPTDDSVRACDLAKDLGVRTMDVLEEARRQGFIGSGRGSNSSVLDGMEAAQVRAAIEA